MDSPRDTGRTGGVDAGRGVLVERFKPSTGTVVGWSGLVVAVFVVGYVAVDVHTLGGLRLALGVAVGAIVVWVTQVRPRVTAYDAVLVLHGSLRDTLVPWASIDDVAMGQTLNVWAHGRRHICVGIGRSQGFETRQRLRSPSQGGLFGGRRAIELSGVTATEGRPVGMSYPSYVLTRINDLRAQSDREHRVGEGAEPPPVQRSWAVPEVLALGVTLVAFVVSLLA